MTQQEQLDLLLKTPRMEHVALTTNNSVEGLLLLVERFTPEFEMVELGSFTGVSTLFFSLFVKKVYSVDYYDYVVPPTGRIPSHDQLFAGAEQRFIERTKNAPNIIKIRKSSLEASKDFDDRSLDAVYIDAEHDYESVRLDIELWNKKVKHGGILCGHDWTLPHMEPLLREFGLINDLELYSDTSWSVVIK